MNILALQYPDSGKLSTDVPDVDTGIDWLVYLARYSQQCQAQSHFVVRSRLDIVENTEIMVGPNQSFYCGTLEYSGQFYTSIPEIGNRRSDMKETAIPF